MRQLRTDYCVAISIRMQNSKTINPEMITIYPALSLYIDNVKRIHFSISSTNRVYFNYFSLIDSDLFKKNRNFNRYKNENANVMLIYIFEASFCLTMHVMKVEKSEISSTEFKKKRFFFLVGQHIIANFLS